MPDFIALDRLGCGRGACPVYRLEVYADGTVLYEGHAGVEIVGGAIHQANPQGVRALFERFRTPAFAALAARQAEGGAWECGFDGQVVVLTVAEGRAEHKLGYDDACEDRGIERVVYPLVDAVDAVACSARWVGAERLDRASPWR